MFKFCERAGSCAVSLAWRPHHHQLLVSSGKTCRNLTSIAFQQQPAYDDSSPPASTPSPEPTRESPSGKTHHRTLTNEAIRAKRNALFSREKTRQLESVRRVEKIEVTPRGLTEECTLVMNRAMSTPYDCALHLSQMLSKRSALALVNGRPWDMHRPLEESCELQLLHFADENPTEANLAFWRTGSLLLSYVADRAFRDNILVELHSWPYQNLQSGSFICDVDLKLDDWTPTSEELQAMTLIISRLIQRKLPIERLDVSADFAMDMFVDNRFKLEQIPRIAEKSPTKDRTVLYRVDDHVEISSGPMVSNTGLIGRHSITAVHPIDCHGIGRLFRFQGVALPAQQPLNYFAWNILAGRAKTFNDSPVPTSNTKR
ncbi:39S ribosomal protein L39, mitochondrial [Hypsibius exemplaris]|uniref:39S ribosomal protein L39, mitochondrial n=1 Tax=Hypsibius exemplaris TaxID=2072580 RepID=A0A1W0WL32_HYPEX|nr:39S ribosomal protein L39, mitochondrial [Hypsibius exemplaris]